MVGKLCLYPVLDLEDRFDDEVVEYFRIAEYTKPNRPTLKEPSNRIPFKQFFQDNFLVAVGLRSDEDKGNSRNL